MKDKKDLSKRLARYGVLAAAITGANEAEANVIYTDEAPDFAGGVGSQYFLDLNNDGTDDFRIWHNGSSNLYISPLTSTNEVLGSGGVTFAYPFALSSGAMISSGAGAFFNNGFAGGFQSLNYGSCSFGNWCSITDRYIGLRFDIGGNIHYGWVRLDVNQSGSVWSVKDYAYEDIIGNGIQAGAMGTPGTASPSSGILGTDIAENSNGLDLQVDFNPSADETSVNEYRVIVVKTASAGTFDLLAAEAVLPANYVSVTPNASPMYTEVFNATSTDTDGDLLEIGQSYTIFVLNIADGVVAMTNSLSTGNDVTLNTTADIALTIAGSDVNDNLDASDLQVDFTAAANETGISEYRVIAVKSTAAGAFDLAAAQALPVTAYETYAASGGPYSGTFNATTTDSDGDAIIQLQPYRLFVWSIADGTVANIDNLTSAGTDVALSVATQAATSIVGSDIADNGNGLDLQVDFSAPGSEAGILSYRVIAVKNGSAGAFDMNAGLALPSTAWMFVNAAGASTYTTVFEAGKTDSDGDLITENQPYTIFVLSFADMQQSIIHSMNNSSSDVTLISYVGLAENQLGDISAYSTDAGILINTSVDLLATDVKLELVNLQGQQVAALDVQDSVTMITSDRLITGVYFLQITNGEGAARTIKLHVNQ